MAYVTTNIRLPEKDWKKYKLKALEEKKSLSAWIRDNLKKRTENKKISGIDKEFSDWTDRFIKKYKPMLEELAKK